MRHVTLFLAATTVFFGSAAALRADSLPASNSTEIAMHDPLPVTAPADATPAPAVVPAPSPVAEIAAAPEIKDTPQQVKHDPIQRAMPPVRPPHLAVTHHARRSCSDAHHPLAHVAKPARAVHIAATPRATAWLAATSEPRCSPGLCSKFVLLGVGY